MCFPFIQKTAKYSAKLHDFIDIWRNICLMFRQICHTPAGRGHGAVSQSADI